MRKIILLMIVGLLIAFMAIGCAKTTTVEEPDKGAKMAGTETVTEEGAQKMAQMPKEDVTGKYMEDATLTAEFNDIYFDFDMYNIKDESKSTLRNLSSWLSQRNAKVIIEGHCDERGTDEYNLGLGDRRANSTKQYLVAAGVTSNNIETISYGEERPQCTEKNESCWSRNRRAHFVILLPK
jgi:peptidoglycan-associated lipoprotein